MESTPPRLLHDYLVFFARSIEDRNAPKHCALCLLGCGEFFVRSSEADADSESESEGMLAVTLREAGVMEESQLNDARTTFCKTVISLLTVPRTSEQLSAFIVALSNCNCADIEVPLISHLHERGVDRMQSWSQKTAGSVLISVLFQQLSRQLDQASAVRIAKGQGRCWPTRIADIVPFGFPALVTTVGQWIDVLEEPCMPLQFFSAALPICGRPLFVAVSTSALFLEQIIEALKATCRRLDFGAQWLDPYPLLQFGTFLYAVMSCRTSQNSITVWTRGHEIQLWRVFSDAARVLRSRERASEDNRLESHKVLASFHNLIRQFSPAVEEPRWVDPDIIPQEQTTNPWPVNTELGLRDVVAFLADLKFQRYCFVIGCPRSFQEIGNTFQKCSGCNVLGYCSSACQAADWKDRKFPHKVYCKKIKVFLGAAGGAKLDFGDIKSFAGKFNRSALPKGEPTLEDIARWSHVRRADVEEWDLWRARTAMETATRTAIALKA
ncbi:hypothetical protein DFH06DRAFT_1344484 [Mycena polygramma]|nr:hypothetical protein DFH06DRAFT_339261 [Mycena polygramma]KAJ7613722.1 hypothetical protein DFH06DRAFT_1344484 [Mycena polygramma]